MIRFEILLPLYYNDCSKIEEEKFLQTAEDTPSNREFIISYKETLKERFQQLDIWITAQQLEVL